MLLFYQVNQKFTFHDSTLKSTWTKIVEHLLQWRSSISDCFFTLYFLYLGIVDLPGAILFVLSPFVCNALASSMGRWALLLLGTLLFNN